MRRALWVLAVLLSHWRRHRMQFATLLIGLIAATALWSGVQAINQQARSAYDRAAATFGGVRTAMLVAPNAATFPQELFVKLRRAGWPVSPVLEGRVQINGRSMRLLGIEPVTLPADVGNAPRLGAADLSSFVAAPGQTLVAQETLNDLHEQDGATPSISSGAKLPPLHVLPQLVPEVLVVDIGVAQRLLNKPDQVSRLLIGKAKGKPAPLASVVGDQLQRVEPTAETELERLTDSFHLNLTAFGLLSFFVGLFIVNSAVGLAFEQRLPMLRTLRACGASARLVNSVLVIELVALALVAGLIGLVCGYFIAAALLPDVAASLRGLYGAQIPGQLTLRPEWWLAGIGISVAGAMVAAATSLIKAIRMPVLATAQPYAWQQRQRRWLILQSLAACAVFAVALLLLHYGQSLIAGFGLLAALMLGAALILPAFLDILLLAGQRFARGPLALWFWADSRQQLSGLSLALMALLLALAVNVGVSTMVETFSRTFIGWLDGRLAADVYISAADNAQGAAIRNWLKDRSEVQAILSGGRAETQVQGQPVELLGLPDHALYRERWPLLETAPRAWTQLVPGNAAFISEQLSRRLNVRVGDVIEVPAPGGTWELDIVGIYADYGNPKGQLAVNVAALIRQFPQTPQTRIGLIVPRGQDPRLDRGAAEAVCARRSQRRRSGDGEGGIDPHLQPHLCGDVGAECLHARRRRHRAADQPADAGELAPAAARAALGDRHHAAAPCRDRADQDAVGRAVHLAAGRAARAAGGVVPDRDRQREGVRLAAAVPCVSAATGRAGRGRADRLAARRAAADVAAGADAAGKPRQGVCQ